MNTDFIHAAGRNPQMRQQARAEIDQLTEAFLNQGGQIEEIPAGVCKDNMDKQNRASTGTARLNRKQKEALKKKRERKAVGAATPTESNQ
ncbi:hypothetical protein [Endozoicomonas lisbonensis]|uniref:Transcriptional regulator SutA RNAP-binding domain-containing protein n=1 Tax=Endozoicomonas lisbonensis TaxID=3120522 RepID=A0ABV2SHZ3_9GAMM